MGTIMVIELCFYHDENLSYAVWSGVANMRKIGLKIAILAILMSIYIKLLYNQ